jgi:hypothetical protein
MVVFQFLAIQFHLREGGFSFPKRPKVRQVLDTVFFHSGAETCDLLLLRRHAILQIILQRHNRLMPEMNPAT